jgi:hypothetical protein
MALFERLTGVGSRPGIPVHLFQATAAEWARGNMTAAQANTIIASRSNGVPLDAGEQAQAQALVNTVPTGSTTANQAARANRLLEIDQVLLLAEHTVRRGLAPYPDAASVATRLGV